MNDPVQTLTQFRVRDIMRGDVVTLRAKDSMQHAASVFHSYGITGAPVVDDDGVCVGVLSTSDFVNREIVAASIPAAATLAFDSMYVKKTYAPAERIEGNVVETYMTPDVCSIYVNDSMLKAARMLCEEHVHRLVVVDGQHRPVGVVSSLDIVACTVVAIEE